MKSTEKTKLDRRLPQSTQRGVNAHNGLWPLTPMEPDLRRATMRNSHYLEFLREGSCNICLREPAEPHHAFRYLAGISYGGLGKKGSDYLAVPLCRQCHNQIHSSFSADYSLNFLQLIVMNLVRYLFRLRERNPQIFIASQNEIDINEDVLSQKGRSPWAANKSAKCGLALGRQVEQDER